MKRKLLSLFVAAALAVSCMMPTITASAQPGDESKIYTVRQDGAGDFDTIQAAADVAQPGDTILVYEGIYREQVIFPRGGTGEDARITLKVAEGEDVSVTGSEIVTGWAEVPEHPGVWSITIPGTIFEEDVGGAFFNPYAVRWQSRVRGQYPTCGTIYLNETPLEEVYQDDNSGSGSNAQKGLLVNANTWKLVAIDETSNDTTVWANFGDVDPNAAGNVTESNAHKQVITGKWNQGYITVDGFTVLRGCAPKAIDFWRSDRASMSGGIATNGGYYWIIENCDVSQCRGVAVDFGLGSRTHEVNSGGTPDLYGYHIIRNNNIHGNQSNGVMAYCGPYTEIYGNILANNNAMNTTLLSEAYVKDVNGGWGIKIYDNYFYSDKTWGTLAIWLDSETDGCVISNNIIYSETGGFNSTYGAILYETCHGWNVCSNNIVVGGYIRLFGNSVSDTYVINNLIIDTPTANQLIHMGRNGTNPGASFNPEASPVPAMGTKEEQNAAAEAAIALGAREIIGLGVEGIGFLGTSGISTSGSEGATYFANGIGVGRSMRPIVPGELTALGTAPIPEYRDYNVSVARLGCTNRYNKLLNNIFFDAKVTGSGAEVDKADYISDWVELTRNYEAIYENGSRSSVFYPATARAVELTSTLYRQYYPSTTWGNRADYNAYYKDASSDFSGYVTGDGYVQDGNSVQKPDTGNYNIEATQDSFKITLTVDESVLDLGKQSYLTVDTFGPANAYKYLGVEWYPDEAYITRDFFGNERDAESNVIGPFADLKAGTNTYALWPRAESHEPTVYTVKQDGTGDFATIQAAASIAYPGDTIIVYEGVYREEVVFPRGGTGEDARITLKAAPGEEVVITGAEIVAGNLWEPVEGAPGVFKVTINDRDYFQIENTFGEFYNPFAQWWRAAGNSPAPMRFTCGAVYVNDEVAMTQLWTLNGEVPATVNTSQANGIRNRGTVYNTPGSWIALTDAYLDTSQTYRPGQTTGGNPNPIMHPLISNPDTDTTTIYANFGDVDPRDPGNRIEINARKQVITAAWNQSYITIDGFKVTRGAGPKTIDFWQTQAQPMDGAISTNGGYRWIIENCEVSQNRGVGIDFGNGSRGKEDYYEGLLGAQYHGNGPDLYGYHIIRYNNVHENATNGMMAYRGAYTEIHGNKLVNNNNINTGLLSEGYIKDVSGGFGIIIRDNYFYNDQTWLSYGVWLDSECDMTRVTGNVFYSKNGGFRDVDYEVNAGWNLFDNNVVVGFGWTINTSSNTYLVNNLWLGIPSASAATWPGQGAHGLMGAEGWTDYSRSHRIVEPGTLNEISTVGNPTSRFENYTRFNKLLNNVFFDRGVTGRTNIAYVRHGAVGYSPNSAVGFASEVPEEFYNDLWTEVVLSNSPNVNPDFSGGTWNAGENPHGVGLPIAWVAAKPGAMMPIANGTPFPNFGYPVLGVGTATSHRATINGATLTWGNECDYNAYFGGAKIIDHQYAAARGYTADANSTQSANGSWSVEADKDSFKLTLDVDQSMFSIDAPLLTSEYLGNTSLYEFLGMESYAPDVDTDFFGNARDMGNNVVGPFANLKPGVNAFVLWGEPDEDIDVAITSPVSKIVAGCAANIPADITFAGEAVSFDLGLYNPDGALIDTLHISADGRYTFKITASDTAKAGAYVIKAVGAASGCAIDCVVQPDDLWAPTVIGGESSVTVVFASDVSFNAAKKSVKIDGVAVNNIKVSVSGKILTIADTTAAAGQTIVIAGVKYADLFPSYSFTFTVQVG